MHKRIYDLFMINKSRKFTSSDIANYLGIVEDDTHSRTRELIRETIETYEIPVFADNTGYKFIESKHELINYLRNLDSRIAGIEERKQIVQKNFDTFYK